MIAFDSVEAQDLNREVFKKIEEASVKASENLATLFGEPEVLKGTGRRNSTVNAVAPTTSSAFILGQVSQSIEPLMSNYYVKDVAKAKVTIKNKYLEELLEKKGKNNLMVWDNIRDNDGSVQQLEFLTEHEKDVFKTFSEINQYAIINQAAARQEYIDQAQSLNIMVNPSTVKTKELNDIYIQAWMQGIKTLYYQHGTNAAQQFAKDRDCVSCEA